MIKIIFLLKKKDGISAGQFREHYEGSHVPLAERYIGHLLQKYTRNYPISAIRNPSGVIVGTVPPQFDFGYDCITEMWVKDQIAVDQMISIFNDPEVNPVLAADELEFLNRGETVMMLSEVIESA